MTQPHMYIHTHNTHIHFFQNNYSNQAKASCGACAWLTKHNEIDSWGAHSDENNKPGTILSSNAVYAGSPVKATLQKVNKQVKSKLIRNF